MPTKTRQNAIHRRSFLQLVRHQEHFVCCRFFFFDRDVQRICLLKLIITSYIIISLIPIWHLGFILDISDGKSPQ